MSPTTQTSSQVGRSLKKNTKKLLKDVREHSTTNFHEFYEFPEWTIPFKRMLNKQDSGGFLCVCLCLCALHCLCGLYCFLGKIQEPQIYQCVCVCVETEPGTAAARAVIHI